MEPLVSVFIPTYNGAKWVAESIESVLNQSFTNFILVLSDDCSTDNTIEIASTFQDSRIIIEQNPVNLNLSHNWKLIKNCKTKYFKILMQDDVLTSDCIKTQVEILENNPNVGITSSSCRLIFIKTQTRLISNGYSEGLYGDTNSLMRSLLLKGNRIGAPSQALIRTSTMVSIPNDLDYPYLGELKWYYYIFRQGFSYYHVSRPLSNYRVQGEMRTLTLKIKPVDEYRSFILKYGYFCGVKLTVATMCKLQFAEIVRTLNKTVVRLLLHFYV